MFDSDQVGGGGAVSKVFLLLCYALGKLPSLKLTANAPENRPCAPKGNKKVSSIFRCELLVSRRVNG